MHTHKESRNREVEQAMREASELPQPSIVDVDPEDPSNLLDDAGQFSVVPLGVEVQPSEEGEADLEAAGWEVASEEEEIDEDSEIDEENAELDTADMTTADAYANAAGDTGDLYGVHTQRAEDRNIPKTPDLEEYLESEEGETWLETLGKSAAEGGAHVEDVVDVVDDSDEHIDHRGHHATESGDRPVADKGSGGEGGL